MSQYKPSENWMKFLFDAEQINNPKPRFYELDIYNKCNGCVLSGYPKNCCSKDIIQNPEVPLCKMSLGIFDKLVNQAIEEKCGIDLTGGGEPTLHPQFRLLVTRLIMYAERGMIPGIALITNGKQLDNLEFWLEKTKDLKNSWVRVSINSQNAPPEFLELMKKYPNRIGLSIIWWDEIEYDYCAMNVVKYKDYAKFIRAYAANTLDIKSNLVTPETCIGRKFVRIYNAKGEQQFCCMSRGKDGQPPEFCIEKCRWEPVDMKKVWEMNPFT